MTGRTRLATLHWILERLAGRDSGFSRPVYTVILILPPTSYLRQCKLGGASSLLSFFSHFCPHFISLVNSGCETLSQMDESILLHPWTTTVSLETWHEQQGPESSSLGHPKVKWVGGGPIFSGAEVVGIVPGCFSLFRR